jgi:hypothetical protein
MDNMTGLHTLDSAAGLILSGRPLLLAGDEALLSALPKGNWIGGTIPYFMTPEGGLHTAERVFVTEVPTGATATARRYDAAGLSGLAKDHPGHGFTILLIPAFSEVHTEYAKNVARYPGIFDRPVVGWISGVALEDVGKVEPRVFDGASGIGTADDAVALHIGLSNRAEASVDIVNLFEPGGGDTISFLATGFSVTDALVNGKPINLARFLRAKEFDVRLPLVADYFGARVNVSIRNVDAETGVVAFFAPVFPDIPYHIAAPVADYISAFAAAVDPAHPAPLFSCNCVLNYVYAGLEGRSTKPLTGPMTFGEIAYMLLNQTAVYLNVSHDG